MPALGANDNVLVGTQFESRLRIEELELLVAEALKHDIVYEDAALVTRGKGEAQIRELRSWRRCAYGLDALPLACAGQRV